jgi:hypothetical protein
MIRFPLMLLFLFFSCRCDSSSDRETPQDLPELSLIDTLSGTSSTPVPDTSLPSGQLEQVADTPTAGRDSRAITSRYRFPDKIESMNGTTWQTYSEACYEQRISFGDSTFLLILASLDTEDGQSYVDSIVGTYTWSGDTISFNSGEGTLSFLLDHDVPAKEAPPFEWQGTMQSLRMVDPSSESQFAYRFFLVVPASSSDSSWQIWQPD